MKISVLSDITTALDDKTLERLAEKLDTPALQVRYGIDLAARHILENLVKHSESLQGAQQVYKKIGEFDGSILSDLRGDIEIDDTVAHGAGSLSQLVGADVDQLIEVIQTSSDTSQLSAARVVGLASALTLDVLGSHKVQLDLNRNGLTEVLRTQTGDTGAPPMRTTDSQPSDLSRPSYQDTQSGTRVQDITPPPAENERASAELKTELFVEPEPEGTMEQQPEQEHSTEPEPAPELSPQPIHTAPPPKSQEVPPESPQGAPQRAPQTKRRVLKAKKTTPFDVAKDDDEYMPMSRPLRILTLAVPVLVILGTTIGAWQIIEYKTDAIERLLLSASQSFDATDTADVPNEVPSVDSAPQTDSDPPIAAIPTESPKTTTKQISFEAGSLEFASRPFRRYEFVTEEDDFTNEPVFASILQAESTKQYAWDQVKHTKPEQGKLAAGPWQVTVRPRNTSRQSYFSYE